MARPLTRSSVCVGSDGTPRITRPHAGRFSPSAAAEPSTGSVKAVLSPRVLRTLEPLSAATGLVVAGPWLYVVADDADELGVFPGRATVPAACCPAWKPIELLADGQWRQVLGLIDALEEGVFI